MDVPRLKKRDAESHKGTYGRALLIGGSRGLSGAIALAGMACVRSGAGLVTLAVPDRCLESVASFDPCYMTVGLPEDPAGRLAPEALAVIRGLSEKATSIGIGPGLAQSHAIRKIVVALYTSYAGPMVVDADALNALAMDQDALLHPGGPRIVTPHVGEFRRLIAADIPAAECRDRAIEFANDAGLIVVMKGHQTRVTDGARTHDNQTGNPGMASGGAGDVLTGVITALLGQGLTPWEAALLGVHVHGLAGDLAKASTGEISLAATDIKDFLALAFQQVGDVA